MNKKNLEILGLEEGATAEQIKTAYESLRAKYLEERFSDGEKGNNAAKMLTKIETAYNELTEELNESACSEDGGATFKKVEDLLKSGDISGAQHVLDSFNERPAQWHYLQSVVFYRKNWINESKKQLEIAIQLDPSNDKYKETYRKLNERINSGNGQNAAGPDGQNYQSQYRGQDMNTTGPQDQMGGGFCANCIDCCYTYLCLSCLCDSCCR